MIWKLLKQHISLPQLAGFFAANLCGMVIVLLGVQFYRDVLPVFTQGDSFIKKDFVIVSKRVSTLGSLLGRSSAFTPAEVADMEKQPFARSVGAFLPSQFKVYASVGMQGARMSTDMFFESVPDRFVDVRLDSWAFSPQSGTVPIIIPRNYLNLYNFGFAQSRGLPQLSEGVMGMVDLDIRIAGGGQSRTLKGRIAGFSNRLNTILVPESFIAWANGLYGGGAKAEPSRLIVEVGNPADDRIARYLEEKGYEAEGDGLDAGKTAWFLKVVTGVVTGVGLVISLLSFYILMLSIYLLLEKNTSKLENLLLIGYSPARVALPYQLLAVCLNGAVAVLGVVAAWLARGWYMEAVERMFPGMEGDSLLPSLLAGLSLFTGVSLLNAVVVRRKVNAIWRR